MFDHDSYNWEIPPSLRALLEEAAGKYASRTLLIFEEGPELTFGEFKEEVDRIAAALAGLGVGKGDLVGIMLPNIPLFTTSWFACLTLGAVIIPVNITYRAEDARYVFNHAEVPLLITVTELYRQTIEEIRPHCPHLSRVILGDGPGEGEGLLGLADLVARAAGPPPAVEIGPRDLASILFTSGTTGYPKGCMHDQSYWLYLAKKVANYAELAADDRLLTAQPFYYMDPQWNVVACLMSGASLVVMKRFSPTRFWDHVLRYGVTWCNAILANLLHKAMPEDVKERHRLRLVSCTIIPTELHRDLEEKTGVPWRANFGMTETGCDLLVPVEADHLVGSGCVGQPVWGREVRVVDDDDRDLPPGEAGEMLFRGTGIMQGYYKNPEATAEAFRGGWFHTGDLVWRDAEGFVYFKGRKKDMVRRSGENISTLEVENVLMSHPGIREAAVIPVPDPVRGEEVKAYLVTVEGQTPETVPPDGVAEYCAVRLAPFKVPRYYEYREDLPRTAASGKVEKYKLKEEKEDLRAGSYDRVEGVWR